ncbi:hypothetical protein [Fidelibacter multiformis]|uniref:hypothetical protein n=1 Tax=Fidelibacter multiformis TaxID=3377529 RepID=UPI0037DC90BA
MPNLTHFTSGNRYPALLMFLLPFLITACFNPEPDDYGLVLEAVDVVCVEATFRVTASGVPETWTCGLYRDDSLVVTETLSGQSGYIRDTGLLPAADYTYHISYMKDGRDKDRSDPVAVTTLDTTSHDFTWTVETLGDAGSYLNDVAIVDENNIYVVGEIRSDSGWYNIGIWNNNQWKFDLVGPVGNILYSVFAFSNNDIWVSNACSPYHWDGNEWTYYRFSSNGVGVNACAGKAIWGSSSDNVWFAGNNGSLVHYDGSRFRRVESGIDVDIQDIDGNDELTVATAWSYWDQNSYLLEIRDKQVSIKRHSSLPNGDWTLGDAGLFYSLDVLQEHVLFNTVRTAFVHWHIASNTTKLILIETTILNDLKPVHAIRANAVNDIYFFTTAGEIAHYNGMTFKHINPGFPSVIDLGDGAVKDELIVAALRSKNIFIGRRNH